MADDIAEINEITLSDGPSSVEVGVYNGVTGARGTWVIPGLGSPTNYYNPVRQKYVFDDPTNALPELVAQFYDWYIDLDTSSPTYLATFQLKETGQWEKIFKVVPNTYSTNRVLTFDEGLAKTTVTVSKNTLLLDQKFGDQTKTTDFSIFRIPTSSDTVSVVGSEAAMTSLLGQSIGYYAYRADRSQFFRLKALPATDAANWQAELAVNVDVDIENALPGLPYPVIPSFVVDKPTFDGTNYSFPLSINAWQVMPKPNLATNGAMEKVASGSTTVYTNLVTNPSMEASSGVVTVRTNLVTNPSFEVDTTEWSAKGSATISRDTTQFYVGSASAKVVTSGAGANEGIAELSISISQTGAVHTASAWVKGQAGAALQIRLSNNVSAAPTFDFVATGAWQRVQVSNTASALVPLAIEVRTQGTLATTFYVDAVQLEVGSTASNYFDGSTAASSDFTYAWSGTAHASTSLQRGVPVTVTSYADCVPISSTDWASTGTKSVRIIATSSNSTDTRVRFQVNTQIGKSYTAKVKIRLTQILTGTISGNSRTIRVTDGTSVIATSLAAPNAIGTHDISVTFTATTATSLIVLTGGASAGNGDVWFDDLIVVEGTYTGDYFDGSSSETNGWDYAWTGSVNASTSTAKASVVTVRTNLVTNPSGETSTTGYASNGGSADYTATVSTEQKLFGSSSIKMVATSSTLFQPVVVDVAQHSFTTSAGKTYTNSIYVYSVFGGSWYARINFWNGSTLTGSAVGTAINVPANTWTRISVTGTAPSNTTKATPLFRISALSAAAPAGSVAYVDGWLVEESSTLGDYFDGSTAASGDFTYAWSGTAHASTSLQRGVGVANVTTALASAFQSTSWASTGTKSLRVIGTSTTNTATYAVISVATEIGKAYTAKAKIRLDAPLAGSLGVNSRKMRVFNNGITIELGSSAQAPNVAGITELNVSFTATTTVSKILLYNGASAGNGDVWWDDLLIVEGEYPGEYFQNNPTPVDSSRIAHISISVI